MALLRLISAQLLCAQLFDGLLEDYDNKFLLTGFDTHGNLLEIMYNLIDEHTAYVFHAMKCRKMFCMLRNQN